MTLSEKKILMDIGVVFSNGNKSTPWNEPLSSSIMNINYKGKLLFSIGGVISGCGLLLVTNYVKKYTEEEYIIINSVLNVYQERAIICTTAGAEYCKELVSEFFNKTNFEEVLNYVNIHHYKSGLKDLQSFWMRKHPNANLKIKLNGADS